MVRLIVLWSQLLCLCIVHLRKNTTLWLLMYRVVWHFVFFLYACKVLFLCSRVGFCRVKKDRFFWCNACEFNNHIDRFFLNVLSNFKEYFFIRVYSYARSKRCCAVHFSWNVCNGKIIMQYKIALAFHKGGGIVFVWKNLVIELLSVMIITGLVSPQKYSSEYSAG